MMDRVVEGRGDALTFLSIWGVKGATPRPAMKCDSQAAKNMEDNVGLVIAVGTNRKFPESKDQLKEWCR